MNARLLIQVFYLSRRSVVSLLRQPELIVPALLFPLLIFGFQSAGLGPATDIPGFPVDSYLDFLLAFPLVQGAFFAAVSTGTDLARDIESGFLNRLSMTPMNPAALLVGILAGVVALSLLQAAVFLAVGLIAGAKIEAGILGTLVLVALTMLTALGFGGIGALLALHTGSGEVVQGLFPLLFVTFFLSSIFLPRDQIETDWFRLVATYNPVSYLVEGIRSLIISGWDSQALALSFGVAGGIVILGLSGAAVSLRGRMART